MSCPSTAPRRPVILGVLDCYWPGEKAGGPVRSLMNLVEHLAGEADFKIITRDRDLGDRARYRNIVADQWVNVDSASVYYMSPGRRRSGALLRLLQDTPHHAVYVNSYFAGSSIQLVTAAATGVLKAQRLVIAPRGQFGPGALEFKRFKKLSWLAIANALGIHRVVHWHATNAIESSQIAALTRPSRPVIVAPNLPSQAMTAYESAHSGAKRPGHLRIASVGRVNRVKNLDLAIRLLADLPGTVELDLFGAAEDPVYATECAQCAERLGPNVTVRFLGSRPHADVVHALSSYDLFFLPTRGENYGHAIQEALAAGCPILVSDQTPWRDIAQHGAGWDISLDQPDAFRDALKHCIAMDAETHRRMAQSARDLACAVSRETVAGALGAYRELFGLDR